MNAPNYRHIRTLTNEAAGIEVRLGETPKGFNVAIFDTDAQEFIGESMTYPTQERAEQYASKCAEAI